VGSDDITPDLTTAEKVVTLAPKACRWPYGDPEHPDFRFCGSPVVAPPYCEHHHAMAYITPRIGGGDHDAHGGLVVHERRPRPQPVSEAQRQRLFVLRRLLWRARKQAANSTAFALPDHVREHRPC
jgi:GcrA cell cycle regulator